MLNTTAEGFDEVAQEWQALLVNNPYDVQTYNQLEQVPTNYHKYNIISQIQHFYVSFDIFNYFWKFINCNFLGRLRKFRNCGQPTPDLHIWCALQIRGLHRPNQRGRLRRPRIPSTTNTPTIFIILIIIINILNK